jgi:hypothetical protein
MTFETFSPAALQTLSEALIALSFGLFYIDGLSLVLEEELSEPEYLLLLAELDYAHLFNITD